MIASIDCALKRTLLPTLLISRTIQSAFCFVNVSYQFVKTTFYGEYNRAYVFKKIASLNR